MSYVSYNNITARMSDASGLTNGNINALGGVKFNGTVGEKITVALSSVQFSTTNILTKDFSVIISFKTPSSNPSPSDAYGLWFIGDSINNPDSIGSIGAWINSDGSLQIFFRNAADGSTGANASYAGFMSAFAGKIVDLAFVRSSSGNPSIYINGQDLSSSFSFSQNSWNWQSQVGSTSVASHFVIGTRGDGNEFIGDIYYVQLYSGALPASAVLNIYLKNGNPQFPYNIAGSFTPAPSKNSQDGGFSANFGSYWTAGNGASSADGVAYLNSAPNANITTISNHLLNGRLYKLFIDVVAADSQEIYISDGSLTTVLKGGITGTGTKSMELFGGLGNKLQIVAKGGTAIIDNVDNYRLGPVIYYIFQGNALNRMSTSFNATITGNISFIPSFQYFYATNFSAQNSTNSQRIKRIGQELDYYSQTGPKSSTISTSIIPLSALNLNQIITFLSYTGNSISGSVIEVPDYRFEKCFLKSMSVNFEPWKVCQASLQFDCYGLMTGSGIFSDVPAEIRHNLISPLRATNISIYNYGPISGKITEYENISFEVSVDRVSNYEIGNEYPAGVNVARITKTLQINGISNADWISDYQSNQEFTSFIEMSDLNSITVNGFLTNQSFSVDANGVAKTNLTIVEEVV